MSEIIKISRCLYCDGPVKVIKDGTKHLTDCKKCGIKELTKLGLNRLLAREK